MTVEWRTTGQDLCSAEARLDVGGTVYLSVESLEGRGWDWMVWDASCQALPRYGLAVTESAAKRQAETSMREVNTVLLDGLNRLQQVASLSSVT